jgi:hypothetical protein
VLCTVQIQLLYLASDDLIYAREHDVINRCKAFQHFNKGLLIANIAHFTRGVRRAQAFHCIIDVVLVG